MLSDTEIRRLRAEMPSVLLEASVLNPPVDANGWLRVEIDNRPGVVEACPWQPRPDLQPAAGDAALVVESDGGNFWVVQWWSQSGFAPEVFATAAALDGVAVPLDARLDVIEARRRVIPVLTPASVIDLGAVAGEDVTGVRISLSGRTVGHGGNALVRLRPNGLTGITTSAMFDFVSHGAAPTYTSTSGTSQGGAPASNNGLAVASTQWVVNSNDLSLDGTFYTRSGKNRHWIGEYIAQDLVTDPNKWLLGHTSAVWHNTATAITGLVLALDAGTFVGRISLEFLP